jgi:hypothetical protein
MNLEATYYRTALLLGLVRGEVVHRWAQDVIEREREPPHAFIDIMSVPPTDLSALRHALWPLVVEPDPPAVLEAMYALLRADLASGRRGLADTVTVLRQMRSMLRLPAAMYADLNAVLVAHSAAGSGTDTIAAWLQQFAKAEWASRQLNPRV